MNISPNDKIVFSLGPLIQRKGYRVLIEAFRGVVEVDTNARCFIGGKGPETPKLKALIKKYGLEGKVQLLGFIPDDQVPFWMNVCDVFVLSSFSEGNPTVMFEALGCGTPFIGTRVGGIPEIITSEEYGYLFEPGDYQDLRNKIIIALGREWDRAGIRKYAQQFTWDSIVQQVLELYRKFSDVNPIISTKELMDKYFPYFSFPYCIEIPSFSVNEGLK